MTYSEFHIDALDVMDASPEPKHWSHEAESSVIGGLIAGGAEAYDAVAGLLAAGDFYGPLQSAAFSAVESLVLAGKPVDLVAVYAQMQQAGTGKGTTLAELHELTHHYVGGRAMRHHADLVADSAASRALRLAAKDVCGIVDDDAIPVADRLNQAQARLEKVQQPRGQAEPQKTEIFVPEFLDELQDLADGKIQSGIPTQIESLDFKLGGGIKPGKQVIIAARPSVGKSSFAQQICLNVAKQGHSAAFFSMEMSCKELTQRAVSNLGRISMGCLTTGKLNNDEWGRVGDAVEQIRNFPLFLDNSSAMTLGDIVAKARALKRKHDLKLLVIDYLQLCSSPGKASDSRHHQIEILSRGLKALATQLQITIITVSQLNREVDKRANARPILSDLKESGSIEEDADTVLLLWRHKESSDGNTIGCSVAKNRGGEIGEVALHFTGVNQRWSESTESLNQLSSKEAYCGK